MARARMALVMAAFMAARATWAQVQPNGQTWTIQWGTNTYGLSFPDTDTNLTASVKSAIRGDINQALAGCPSHDIEERIYLPSDPQYGTYTGRMRLANRRLLPKDIAVWPYKILNGTRHLCVETNLAARYLAQIALTNQYAAEVSSLSNFIHTVQNATTATVSYRTFKKWWWSPFTDAGPKFGDISKNEYTRVLEEFGEAHMAYPSILEFQYTTIYKTTALFCEVRTWEAVSPDEVIEIHFLYKNKKWRLMATGQ